MALQRETIKSSCSKAVGGLKMHTWESRAYDKQKV